MFIEVHFPLDNKGKEGVAVRCFEFVPGYIPALSDKLNTKFRNGLMSRLIVVDRIWNFSSASPIDIGNSSFEYGPNVHLIVKADESVRGNPRFLEPPTEDDGDSIMRYIEHPLWENDALPNRWEL